MIVAINTDKNAPIFDFAHVGIVTDAIRFLPALTEAFRKRLSPHRMTGSPAERRRETTMIDEKFDAIVIGAGMSGNAAAYTHGLARPEGAATRARRISGLEERAGRASCTPTCWKRSSRISATMRRWSAT